MQEKILIHIKTFSKGHLLIMGGGAKVREQFVVAASLVGLCGSQVLNSLPVLVACVFTILAIARAQTV